MIVMLYHEMVVMQRVLLLSLDILVLHHEMLVKISMNVHLLQTIAIPMQHVPILHEVFLVLVFLDLQETVPYDIVMQYVEMVLWFQVNEKNVMITIQQMEMDALILVFLKHLLVLLILLLVQGLLH